MGFPHGWSPGLLSVLRFLAGVCFIGRAALTFQLFPVSGLTWHHSLFSLGFGGAEIVAGALIAVGLFTRPVASLAALAAAGNSFSLYAFALFGVTVPGHHDLDPRHNHIGEMVLIILTFSYVAAAGGGSWSIDAILHLRAKKAPA